MNPGNADALAAFTATFKAALNGGKAISMAPTTPPPTRSATSCWWAARAFAATDHDKADPNNLTMDIWNPWGVSLPTPPGPVQGGCRGLSQPIPAVPTWPR